MKRNKDGLTFDEWFTQLLVEAKNHNWPVEADDKVSWEDYYADDYTPHDAVVEDMDNA